MVPNSHSNAKKPVQWLLLQQTSKGPRYYTGKGNPISPDSWTPSINRAGRFLWDQVVNMREWVSANTSGAPIERVKY